MSSFTNIKQQIARKKAQIKFLEAETPQPTTRINELKDEIVELETKLASTSKRPYSSRAKLITPEQQEKDLLNSTLDKVIDEVGMQPFDEQLQAVTNFYKRKGKEKVTETQTQPKNKRSTETQTQPKNKRSTETQTQPAEKAKKKTPVRDTALKAIAHTSGTAAEQLGDLALKGASKVQSLLFDNKEFTPGKAKKWAKEHGFISPKIHETEKKIRLRQYDPEEGEKFRTLQLKPGVQGIISVPKETPHFAPILNPKTTTKRREPGPQPEPEEPKAPKAPKKKKGKAIPQIDYPSSTLIVASKFSGKTNLILNIVDKNKFDNIFIITQTGHLGNLKRLCISDDCLLKDISDDFVKELLDIQKGSEMQTLLIFDDVVGMKLDTRKMRQLYTSGRNFGISIIMSIQDLMKVPTAFRRNLEYVFGGNMTMSNQEAFGKEYGQSTFPKKRILEVLGEIARDNAHDWLFHDFRHRTWKKILGSDLKKFF